MTFFYISVSCNTFIITCSSDYFTFSFLIMSNHSFYLASNTSSTSTLHIIFNLISLTATALGTFISFVILICVLLRKRTFKDVPLLLCTNNYLLVFVLGISELLHNVNTLRGDLEFLIMDKTTVMCRIHAYIQFSLVSAVYLACILQVGYLEGESEVKYSCFVSFI